jgi:hypothetical protein
MIGQKFNKLTVIAEVKTNGKNKQWKCICDCGKETIARQSRLQNGDKKSCGCFGFEQISTINKKHGRYKHPLYCIWLGMIQRCTKKNQHNYSRYGGRGIKVCDRWFDIENFIADMGERPSLKHTLERVNNDGDYGPDNCCWATMKEQSLNKRQAHILTFNGKSQTLREWADELHIKYSTLACRVDLYGWTTEKALTTPVASRNRKKA